MALQRGDFAWQIELVDGTEQLRKSTWISAKCLTVSHMTSSSSNWRDVDLIMDHSVDEELAGWQHTKSYGQWLIVHMGNNNTWCPLGSLLGLILFIVFSVAWTVEAGAPSADLLTTASCVVQWTCWREGMPSRGTRTGLRGGPVQTLRSSTKGSTMSYIWVVEIPSTFTGWTEKWLRAPCRERFESACWWKTQHELAMCTHSPEGQQCPALHQKHCGQQVEGQDSPPIHCSCETSTWSAESSFGVPNIRRTWNCWSKLRWGSQSW